MRRLILPTICLAVLALAGCGGTGSAGGDAGPDAGLGIEDLVGGDADVGPDAGPPPCPFTAATASELVGEKLVDSGPCVFGDGKGVAGLTVTMSSSFAAEVTYDYQRNLAGETFDTVTDLNEGGKGYLAVKDIGAEAVLIGKAGAYTLNLSNFEHLGSNPTPAAYDPVMRKLLAALPH
ncbi:hypothetical protein [Rhizomonospora bruguierae]|uniref:hypothetical protein n=1 Tax=Rhizomonospora bruguierae TaxID=1581705 RepID=UPI001BCC661F|nr:hypothetical protein [Micromonospora sp. NBRC 107566]